MTNHRWKVKRAIIMAAGMGKRMRPLTLETPKPLLKVNGVRMIDSIINGLHTNGIEDIYIVVGYMKEQFSSLPKDYVGVKLIENPYYDIANNISSLYVAREYIEDSIIIDGDQLISNAEILNPSFELSGYNVLWSDDETSEWLLQVKDGVIKQCSRTGGRKGWKLFSISRWSSEDGKKLRKHLEIEFEEKQNYEIYWDDVALFCYPEQYRLGIREMKTGDVVEIDELVELIAYDKGYSDYLSE
ncbi:NTP transferase domain-containing protein [Aerococcaceae bacterium NML180378]|nr:NTP transferase domain-containing protein [Aerococcaceae bacterium NML180378]